MGLAIGRAGGLPGVVCPPETMVVEGGKCMNKTSVTELRLVTSPQPVGVATGDSALESYTNDMIHVGGWSPA